MPTWRCLDKDKKDIGDASGEDLQDCLKWLRISESYPSIYESKVVYLKAKDGEIIKI